MVEVFHAPVPPDYPTDLKCCFDSVFNGCAKQTGGHLGFSTLFLRTVNPSAFNDLGDVRERTDLGVHWDDGDVSNFVSSVAFLQFPNQIHRASLEEFFGVFEIVFLVFLNSG